MGWKTVTLNDAYPVVSKGKPPKYVAQSNVFVLNQACVHWDKIAFENVKYQDEVAAVKVFDLFDGDILLNSTGTGTLGRCNIFVPENNDVRYIADSHLTVLRGSKVLSNVFFKYFMKFGGIQARLYAECVAGSTNQVDIVKEKLLRFKLFLPSLALQNRFADFVQAT
ncbi:MAG: restriction endonuclease subunit S, partial [Nitrososphaerota archaeon]|nr:restriction endonuclease subunit S [Nitrososphaerota archaeon]